MKTIEGLIQGTSEWLAFRAQYLTASEAPAMLGLSKYMQRAELLRQKATGIVQEVDEATQRRFDAGHASEAITRAWAENFIGEDLYPVTGTVELDGGLPLLASFDGLTLDESVAWENKLWNESFAAEVRAGDVPDTHWPQLEHQMLVSGAKKVLFTVSDGAENIESLWYESRAERRSLVIAGWRQFVADLANYQPEPIAAEVIGRAPETLPALHVEVTGMVTSSNLLAFKETALAVFRGINTDLQTDADFADAEKTVKWCKDVEDRLEQTKQHALGQTASIDELFRTMDGIKEEARTVRLTLDKLVKAEKENRKAEIVAAARQAIELHVAEINKRIGGAWLPKTSAAPFAEAIKGLKSLDSMRDKVGAALANAKIEASAMADRIEANLRCIDDAWMFLFQDFGQICTKDPADFARIVGERIQQENARAAAKLEAERARIRAEEQAKAEREAQAKALEESDRIRAEERKKMQDEQNARNAEMQRQQAEQDARDAETARQRALEQAAQFAANAERANSMVDMGIPISDSNQQVETGATMKLGEICERLGFSITAQFLASIGFEPVGHERASKLYRSCDYRAICIALVKHITTTYTIKEFA